jgi:protein SCO1
VSGSVFSRKALSMTFIAVVSTLLGAWLASNVWQQPDKLPALSAGTVLSPVRLLPQLSLVDQDGKIFDNNRLKGRWSFLYFGFTNCPEICPTTMAMLKNMVDTLQDLPDTKRPQIVLVSVDAKRDTPEVMKAYVHSFDAQFVGVTGEQSALDALTTALGVPSKIMPMDNGNYMVDHSTAILAINPKGEWQVLFSAPHSATGLANDLRVLVAQ